jgi:REP element-mobilizing transposase RayT
MCIYGYVVMPEHVHLLVSEPERTTLADAIHYLTGCGKTNSRADSAPSAAKAVLKTMQLPQR